MSKYVGVLRHTHGVASETFVRDQVRVLGVPTILLSRDGLAAGLGGEGLPVRAFAASRTERARYTMLRDTSRLRAAMIDGEVALLHAHFGVEGMYAQRAASRLDIPVVTTLHGYDVAKTRWELARSGSPSWLWYAAGRTRFFHSSSAFVAVSDHVAHRAQLLGVDRRRLNVIPTGVDLDRFTPAFEPTPPVILHVGRLVKSKGTSYLIAALARVLARVPEAVLRIIGDGPERLRLESQAIELGLASSVQFLGRVDHDAVVGEMRRARLLCLPSVSGPSGAGEALGQVLLEAAAGGRPVVITSCGGMSEAVLDGTSGIVVPERDPEALAEGLVALLSDEAMADRFGAAGRRLMEQKFDLRVRAAEVVALYRSLGFPG